MVRGMKNKIRSDKNLACNVKKEQKNWKEKGAFPISKKEAKETIRKKNIHIWESAYNILIEAEQTS